MGHIGRIALCAALCGIGSPVFAGEVRYSGEGHAYNPVWSRDGKYLAFEVNQLAGDVELYVSEITGAIAKDAVRVTLPGGTSAYGGKNQVLENATWVRGNVAVFEGSNQGGQFRLYTYSPSGGAATELIPTSQVPGDLTFPHAAEDNSLAFIADASGAGDIRVRNPAGALAQITSTSAPEVFPTFLQDGSKLAFSRKTNNTEDLFELVTASKTEATVSGGGGDQTRPIYAGGKLLFFDDSRGDNVWDVSVVDAPGGTKRALAKGVRLPLRSRPAVSPDGKYLAFTYDDPTKSSKVVVTALDGSKSVDITTTFTACGEPALTMANGRYILAYTALPSANAAWRFLYVEDITDKL
jgi:dipeptidyl aminopeptidase/acylaminoacyl peptidase